VDREEFTIFYTASFPRLVGQLYAMTGDQGEAQDAVQEAFVRAWVHRALTCAGADFIRIDLTHPHTPGRRPSLNDRRSPGRRQPAG
jgi:sigma-70-like protein